MDILASFSWNLLFTGLALGVIAGLLLKLVSEQLTKHKMATTAAVITLIIAAYILFATDPTWLWMFVGLALGLWITSAFDTVANAVKKSVVAVASAAFVAALLWFGGIPLFNALVTPDFRHWFNLRAVFNEYARGNIKGLNQIYAGVMARAKDGELNQGEQGAALLAMGRAGNIDAVNYQRAELERQGKSFGDFGLAVNRRVEPIHGTTQLDMSTLWTAPKQLCYNNLVTIRGLISSDRYEGSIGRRHNAAGWTEGDPVQWLDYPKVYRRAPYMAVLMYIGNNPEPFYEWQPANRANTVQAKLYYNGCATVRFAVNDFITDNKGWPVSSFFAANEGTEPLAVGDPTGGLQITFTELSAATQ